MNPQHIYYLDSDSHQSGKTPSKPIYSDVDILILPDHCMKNEFNKFYEKKIFYLNNTILSSSGVNKGGYWGYLPPPESWG